MAVSVEELETAYFPEEMVHAACSAVNVVVAASASARVGRTAGTAADSRASIADLELGAARNYAGPGTEADFEADTAAAAAAMGRIDWATKDQESTVVAWMDQAGPKEKTWIYTAGMMDLPLSVWVWE